MNTTAKKLIKQANDRIKELLSQNKQCYETIKENDKKFDEYNLIISALEKI